MGRLAKVLSFVRFTRGDAKGSEATVDPGGGANVVAGHFTALGDDSHPLPGDYAVLVDGPGTGVEVVVAYADPINAAISTPGDKIIYARNAASGVISCRMWLKASGDILIQTASGAISITAAGVINANGVTVDGSGNMTTTGTITAAEVIAGGKSLAVHVHSGVTTGPSPTGPNT